MREYFNIILVRLDALRSAIAARRWRDSEFEFDRVLRAVTKARDVACPRTTSTEAELDIQLLRSAQDVVNDGVEGGAAPGSWIDRETRERGVLVDPEIFGALRDVVRRISDEAERKIRAVQSEARQEVP